MTTRALGLARLMAWLSPIFPTGSFAYSAGLESAVHEDIVSDEGDLYLWLETQLQHGGLRNDAIFIAESWRASSENLPNLAAHAESLAPSAERHAEIMAQGEAYLKAIADWGGEAPSLPLKSAPLTVAIGASCSAANISLEDTLTGVLQATLSNQLQAAIRLSVIGQSGASRLLAKLEPATLVLIQSAQEWRIDDLGSATLYVDMLSMKHETQPVRLFRS